MAERSAEEIRREIDRTRADMDEKADALQQKLSPGEIFEDVWNRMKRNGGLSQFGDLVRDHPVPIALMGLGLGWLAIERATGSAGDKLRRRYGDVEPGTWEAAEGRRGPYLPDDVSLREADDGGTSGVAEKLGPLKERASGVVQGVKDAASRTADSVRHAADSARHAAGSTRETMGGARDRAQHLLEEGRERAHHVRRGLSTMLDDYPLAVAAIAFGIGLAAGASAPSTRMEQELMGEASDALKDDAKDATRRAVDQLKSVTRDAAESVKEQAGEARR